VLLAAVAAATLWVDRNVEPSEYRPAHLVLRWMSLGAFCVVAHLAVPPRRLGRSARRAMVAAAIAAAALPVACLRSHHHLTLAAMLARPLPALVLTTARVPTDFDRDGHGIWLGGADCAPFDRAVHPGAKERPANGVDDNCRLGDAPAVEEPPWRPINPCCAVPTSVVLITIDAVCARRTSLYGARRRTTPRLDRWAERALVFERAYTTGGWTSLALASLFYGRYPRRLRYTPILETTRGRLLPLAGGAELRADERPLRQFELVLDEPRPPLWRWLAELGYVSVAVVDDGESAFLSSSIGAFAGFDRYLELDDQPPPKRDDAGVTDAALAELALLAAGPPFLLWVHYYGPHKPSTRHPDVEWYGDGIEERYDHELRYADEQVGRLLAAVSEGQRQRPIAVIVASDHGESFGRRRRGHGWNLEEDAIRIPMMLQLPDGEGRRVEQLASLVDLVPTVLALAEVPRPRWLDGRPLMLTAEGRAPSRVLLSETWSFTAYGERKRDMVAAFDGHHKLVVDFITGARRLTTQDDRGGNLLGQVDASHLADELDRFMETN
ncbi:MAG: sulfatase-like hydrolase/transferase, partial [Deltaproteobacteria bacterium]|jgi:hypothetical protein|nr:sulfatase-like hydrolase/transferase [Deltaproteobacteria bacterium]MBW2534436.1 sulfatase-like hydrolase/transferase [Deltaproteobacteria bacterium]